MLLYHYRAAGFNFSTSCRRSGLDGMWGCGNRDGLLCNLSPIDQVQLTAHPHKYIQRIWIALDMQMMCWVKPVGERWRSEKKNKRAIHSSSTFCTSARIWFLRKLLKEGVKLYAKQQILPKIVPLKKSHFCTWVKSRLFFFFLVQTVWCGFNVYLMFQWHTAQPCTHSTALPVKTTTLASWSRLCTID